MAIFIRVAGATLEIPLAEIEFSYARSSGPGGQNVNKVNSKVVLRWNAQTSPSVPEQLRGHLLARLATRITQSGEIVVASDRFRDQPRNRGDCLEKLERLLEAALAIPIERKETRPTRASRRRLRHEKNRNSEKKKLRRSPRGE